MDIQQVGMTRRHYEPGELSRIRMVVLHATAGRAPGDYHWLRKGGDSRRPVSIHYYIDKQGRISQMVADQDIAWHAGRSRWVVDGREMSNCNAVSLGIELENLNSGRDPYPEAQYAAALWLVRRLVSSYQVPRTQLVRHLDIAPGRKTDPAGFPWERFVGDVYHELELEEAEAAPALPDADAQLRRLLADMAYRVAGGALPAQWPLEAAAAVRELGMPVAAIAGRHFERLAFFRRPPGSAQDDLDRAVRLAGSEPLVVEVYARDTLFIEATLLDSDAVAPEQIGQLSELPEGPLRNGLLDLLFRAADPVAGFQPRWRFHQDYLEQMGALGTPIGPNHRLAGDSGDGRRYACQHFAFDTLCSPAGDWKTVYRLSELAARARGEEQGDGAASSLAPEVAGRLQQLLLDDLYLARTRRRFDAGALLVRHALERKLGAPLAPAEVAIFNGTQILMMPFAGDLLACPLPAGWQEHLALPTDTPVTGLRTGVQGRLVPLLTGQQSLELSQELPLLGAIVSQPQLYDLTLHIAAGSARGETLIDCLVLYSAAGPPQIDLASVTEPHATTWHYYIDRGGAIYRLVPEGWAASAAGERRNGLGAALDMRSITLAVEGGVHSAPHPQALALAWLVRRLMRRYRIASEYVFVDQVPGSTRGSPA